MHPIEPNNDSVKILAHMFENTATTKTTIANEVALKQWQWEEITKAFNAGGRRLESIQNLGETFLLAKSQPELAQGPPNS